MAMFCNLQDLKNESDVEQKLLWPLLTSPQGLCYSPAEIFTKPNIQNFEIEKGNAKKVYRPDYILVLAGMPVVVIEAKHPDEDVYEALREARLYAAELNGFHPAGVNPCVRLVVSNGRRLVSSPADTATPDVDIEFAAISMGSLPYHTLLGLIGREPMQNHADHLRRSLRKDDYRRAINLIGGNTARNEEVGYNEFGSRISIDFLHVFNPQTRQDRAEVVRHAYVRSKRREHYSDEIDRVIRTAMPTPVSSGKLIEDTSSPTELLKLLGRGADLQNRIFLLIGSVGAGKSTFVDYLREVKLDEQVKRTTAWISINLNGAPIGKEELQRWIVDQFIRTITSTHPEEKLSEYESLMKVFGTEMRDLKGGALKMLPDNSEKYREIIATELLRLTGDRITHATALARHLCAERGKVLVLVLDNCDKGDLEEQLTVFQIVRWVQTWLKCLVFLPIRDVTYHAHKNKPPLDTVIKDFVFRVESPPFGDLWER
jgi:Type I restriction enzyme R protein N terminus (HSDR_N)